MEPRPAADALGPALAALPGGGFAIGEGPGPAAEEEVGVRHGLTRLRELHAQGASTTSIAAALNAEGLRTPRGTRWHSTSVASVVAGLSRR